MKTEGDESESLPLLSRVTKSYDSCEPDVSECVQMRILKRRKSYADVRRIPVFKLYEYSTDQDKVILGIGTISAVIHGTAQPLMSYVFGEMTETFFEQQMNGFANDSSAENGTSGGMTQEEFGYYMADFSLYYVYIGVMVCFATLFQALCWEWSCERQTHRLRQAFFYQVLRQEMTWYDGHQTGDLAFKLADDLERVREGIGLKFSTIFQYGGTFVSGFAVGFYANWRLTLMIMAFVPLLVGSTSLTGKLIFTETTRERQKFGKAGAVAEEALSCMKTVQSFGGEQREIERYKRSLQEGLEIAIRKYHILSLGVAATFFLMFSSYGLAFWYGSTLVMQDLMSRGQLFTVFSSVLVGSYTLVSLAPAFTTVKTAQSSLAVVSQVLDSMPCIDSYSKAGIQLSRVVGKIQFQHLSFSYPSRNEFSVIRNMNLNIEAGKTVAIVGTSGVGKSTIINLILRLYDPNSGSILVDGHDIKTLNLYWLRNQIGVVTQEPVLFDTSIYENIRYGKEDVSPEEVVAAARVAMAHEFIGLLPSGYETITGERGAQLSGGQKQRIAIARALVRNPKILILDEATSALDAQSEAAVQNALSEARHGRTTVIIVMHAHRLSTIKNADVIYALKDGCVYESGNHEQLMAKEGLYFKLATSQTTTEVSDSGNASVSYDSNEDSTKEFFDNERRFRRRIRHERKKIRTAFPDPDQSRIVKEAAELNVVCPGKYKIFKATKPEWFLLAGGAIGSIIVGFSFPVFGYLYAEMFQRLSQVDENLRGGSIYLSYLFLVLAIVSACGFWLQTLLIGAAGENLTMRLRLQTYNSVVRQPVSWFDEDRNGPGRLVTRLARDAPLVKGMVGTRYAAVVTAVCTVSLGLGFAFMTGWQLAFVLLLGFPILVMEGYNQNQFQTVSQKKYHLLIEEAGRVANEAMQNIKTIQSLALERLFYDKYVKHLAPIKAEGYKHGLKFALIFAFAEGFSYFIVAAVFYFGAYLVEQGIMNPTNVYRVFFTAMFAAYGVGNATSMLNDFTKSKLAAGLIFNMIETPSAVDPFSSGLRPILNGRITFNDVLFSYPTRPEIPVLQNLTFDLKPGTTLALVGPSGCGKSTVVSLLERFYDVSDGRILLDGIDIRSIQVAHLRSLIGLVTQEPVLFDITIRENIAYGYGDGTMPVSDELVIEAAKSASIHKFITSLPQGYDTVVGERGTQMSGGQKQRISIARALIRKPKILLLDEATSALDSESELIVQEALDKARLGRTCIIIAHRLSTIQSADCIAVMDHGRIVEMGTHDQLIRARRIYFKLTKKQQITH